MMLFFYSALIEEDDNKTKLEKLYVLYSKKMWYAANSVLSDAYLAEDAVHNAFIGIAKNIKKISDVESAKTLAYVITASKNAAIDMLRQRKGLNEANIDDLYDVSDKESSSLYEAVETEELVVNILKQMPETYRDVLYLLLAEQMTEKEIAILLGRKPGTVHQQVKRGRTILKKLMKGVLSNENK